MNKLPRKGYKQITVTDALHKKIQDTAKAADLSMPGLIRVMLLACYPETIPNVGEEEM